jgi:hypothetical protein
MEQECVISGLNLALSRTETFISPFQILCFDSVKTFNSPSVSTITFNRELFRGFRKYGQKKISLKNVTKKTGSGADWRPAFFEEDALLLFPRWFKIRTMAKTSSLLNVTKRWLDPGKSRGRRQEGGRFRAKL